MTDEEISPVKERSPVQSPEVKSPGIDEGIPEIKLVPTMVMSNTVKDDEGQNQKRVAEIDDLARTKGAHYSVFKSKANLLALFDACKSFEEDKASLISGAAESTDDSNEQQDEGAEDDDDEIVE